MDLPALTTRDDFEYWLASMDDYLEEFIELFSEQEREQLDFSPASLDLAERWILETYPDTPAMLDPKEGHRVNLVACYIGETFRKVLGGKWDIRLNDPEFAYFGMPIIVQRRGTPDSECPLTLATAAADRRTGSYLRMVLENS